MRACTLCREDIQGLRLNVGGRDLVYASPRTDDSGKMKCGMRTGMRQVDVLRPQTARAMAAPAAAWNADVAVGLQVI